MESIPAQVRMSDVLASSFRDFHAKGVDYLCLQRSEAETIKVYFFEGDVTIAAEAVIPHDHRYGFYTHVLAGEVVNHEFVRSSGMLRWSVPFERFDYVTPLNGGSGFEWRETDYLRRINSVRYRRSEGYMMSAAEIHTITVGPDTVLLLYQHADQVPIGQPTRAWRPPGMREPPSLDGLYRPMDADRARFRLAQFSTLAGLDVELTDA